MFEYLDRRYALALYEVAEEKGKVQEYLNDLREICDLIDNNKDFYEVVKHPLLSFLLILIEKDRILFLREKLNEMKKIDLERKNTYRGIVKTTEHLSEEQYNKLLAKLEKKYNKKIILEQVIDPSILGGIYVRVNNEVMDGTVKLRLEELKKLMVSAE